MSTPSYWVAVAEPGNVIAYSTSTSITFSGLLSGITYNVNVFGIYGNNAPTSISTTYVITTNLNPTTSIIATATTSSTASLSWTAPSAATVTYYSIASNPVSNTTTSASTSTSISGLSSNTFYIFTITANSANASSTASSTSIVTYPAAPIIGTAAVLSYTSASVSFTPTIGGNYYSISSYKVTSSAGQTSSGTSTSLTVTGLIAGTSYTFYATETTIVGSSIASANSNAIITPLPPPTNIVATTVSSSASNITLTAPFSGTIAYYSVTSSPSVTTWTSASTTIPITGLTSNTSYIFYIVANNAYTSAATSTTSSVTYPAAPTGVTAAALNYTSASVSFTPTIGGNYYTITTYTVTSSAGQTVAGTSTSLTVTGLTAGNSYTFYATETTIVGVSSSSSNSNAIITPLPPPTNIVATAVSSSASNITLTAPFSGTITYYSVTSSPSVTTWTSASTTIPITGLTSNTSYVFSIVANTTYTSAATSTTSSVTYPAAPTGVTASALNYTSASVSFTPTIGGNYYSISSYKVTSSAGQTAAGTSTALTITGLTAGTSYTFYATETTTVGVSSASVNSNSIVTPLPPPTNIVATANQNTTVTVTLTAPFLGTITSYSATSSPSVTTWTSASTTIPITGLTGNTSYVFSIVANSSATSSSTSTIASVTYPSAPTITSIGSISYTSAAVSFTGSTGGGYSSILSYTVTSSGGQTAAGTTSPITVTGLTSSTNYTFTITETTSIGTSLASSTSSQITTLTIPTPSNISNVSVSLTSTSTATMTITPGSGGGIVDYYSVNTLTSTYSGVTTWTSASTTVLITGLYGNGSYSFNVTAVNGYGTSNVYSTGSYLTTPNAPSSVTISSFSDTGASVSFVSTNNTSNTYYGLVTQGFTPSNTLYSPILASSLQPNRTYTLGVYAVSSGSSGNSSTTYASPFTTLPPTPSSIIFSSIGSTSVSVSFSNSINPGTAYSLSYSMTGLGTSASTSSPLLFTGLIGNTYYNPTYLTVTTPAGSIQAQNYGSFVTYPATPSSMQSYYITTSTSATLYSLSFSQGTAYPVTYYFYYNTSVVSGTSVTYATSSVAGAYPSFNVSGLIGNTYYNSYYIKAYANFKYSDNPISYVYFTTLPSPPTSVTVISYSSTDATLSYVPASNGTYISIGYSVYSTPTVPNTTTTATPNQFYLYGLKSNETYSAGVMVNGNTSLLTYAASFTTPFTTLISVTTSSITSTTVYLNLTPTYGSINSITYTILGGGSTTSTSSPLYVTGLTGNTTYTLGVTVTCNGISYTAYASAFTTLPRAPTSVSVIQTTSTTAFVSFLQASQGTDASITYSLSGGGTPTLTSDGFNVTGLSGGTTGANYTFTVTATNSTGSSSKAAAAYNFVGVYKTASAGGKTVNTYFQSTTLSIPSARTIYVLAVGGGGGGGAAGGGAGGVVQSTIVLAQANTITITIGAGGAGRPNVSTITTYNGGNTTVSFSVATSNNITAYGGGCGGALNYPNSGSGGSSGGKGGSTGTIGTAVVDQGQLGGSGGYKTLGGGGGAGWAGGGEGGVGVKCTLTGITTLYPNTYWAGGGGGMVELGWPGNGEPGGAGGGGAGSQQYNGYNVTGTPSQTLNDTNGLYVGTSFLRTDGSLTYTNSAGFATGSGGGGNYALGGNGGSGCVVIAF